MKVSIDAYVALGLTVSQANPGITCRQTTGRGAGVDLRPCGLARHPNNDHYFVNLHGAVRSKVDPSIDLMHPSTDAFFVLPEA